MVSLLWSPCPNLLSFFVYTVWTKLNKINMTVWTELTCELIIVICGKLKS